MLLGAARSCSELLKFAQSCSERCSSKRCSPLAAVPWGPCEPSGDPGSGDLNSALRPVARTPVGDDRLGGQRRAHSP
eukprot:10716376-Alexandrium_andersonii.AAC.1